MQCAGSGNEELEGKSDRPTAWSELNVSLALVVFPVWPAERVGGDDVSEFDDRQRWIGHHANDESCDRETPKKSKRRAVKDFGLDRHVPLTLRVVRPS
jgi:hypothetical protein